MTSTRSNKLQLSKTGQTTSYYSNDDGSFQAGSTVAPRFIDNGDNTISDRHTNLRWIKDMDQVIPWSTDLGSWAGGNSYSVGDMVELANYDTGYNYRKFICVSAHTSIQIPGWSPYNQYYSGNMIHNPNSNEIMSCTTDHYSTTDFNDDWYNQGWWSSTGQYDDFYYDSGNWIMTPWVGINPYGSGYIYSRFYPTAPSQYEGSAMDYAFGVTIAGKTWRVPNIRELLSLVDYGTSQPAVDTLFAALHWQPGDYYMSSTTFADYTGYMWVMDFNIGWAYYSGDPSQPRPVLLVTND